MAEISSKHRTNRSEASSGERATARESGPGLTRRLEYPRPAPGSQPEYLHPAYVSTQKRAPLKPLIVPPHTVSELTGPVFGHSDVGENDYDLTKQHAGEPLGERIIVTGRVLDEDRAPFATRWWRSGRQMPRDVIATGSTATTRRSIRILRAGPHAHQRRGEYRLVTVKPGAYPWLNHYNAWRPAHIHFSLFGAGLRKRLVTQMYFPGDPLLPYDPIFKQCGG